MVTKITAQEYLDAAKAAFEDAKTKVADLAHDEHAKHVLDLMDAYNTYLAQHNADVAKDGFLKFDDWIKSEDSGAAAAKQKITDAAEQAKAIAEASAHENGNATIKQAVTDTVNETKILFEEAKEEGQGILGWISKHLGILGGFIPIIMSLFNGEGLGFGTIALAAVVGLVIDGLVGGKDSVVANLWNTITGNNKKDEDHTADVKINSPTISPDQAKGQKPVVDLKKTPDANAPAGDTHYIDIGNTAGKGETVLRTYGTIDKDGTFTATHVSGYNSDDKDTLSKPIDVTAPITAKTSTDKDGNITATLDDSAATAVNTNLQAVQASITAAQQAKANEQAKNGATVEQKAGVLPAQDLTRHPTGKIFGKPEVISATFDSDKPDNAQSYADIVMDQSKGNTMRAYGNVDDNGFFNVTSARYIKVNGMDATNPSQPLVTLSNIAVKTSTDDGKTIADFDAQASAEFALQRKVAMGNTIPGFVKAKGEVDLLNGNVDFNMLTQDPKSNNVTIVASSKTHSDVARTFMGTMNDAGTLSINKIMEKAADGISEPVPVDIIKPVLFNDVGTKPGTPGNNQLDMAKLTSGANIVSLNHLLKNYAPDTNEKDFKGQVTPPTATPNLTNFNVGGKTPAPVNAPARG